MASYSKVFKAAQVSVLPDVKVITRAPIQFDGHERKSIEPHEDESKQMEDKVDQILSEAKQQAAEIVASAEQKAHALELETSDKINQWWTDNENKLEAMTEEAKERGYQEGFEWGKMEAEEQIQREYSTKTEQIQQLLLQAYEQKQEIISEAEPFLLELSTVIAEQIVRQELEGAPEKFVELIKQHILRFKEKESITVCVHPGDFDFIQAQRSQLISVVNGETEIKIIPDHSVSPKGCIIRTAFGSVDARIDTQIEEIKKAILEARREPEHVASH
jgi:flagellar assembly protein FliH